MVLILLYNNNKKNRTHENYKPEKSRNNLQF